MWAVEKGASKNIVDLRRSVLLANLICQAAANTRQTFSLLLVNVHLIMFVIDRPILILNVYFIWAAKVSTGMYIQG